MGFSNSGKLAYGVSSIGLALGFHVSGLGLGFRVYLGSGCRV